ncbi:MAG: Abi family protein [Rheinheimera sp.]|nr:MAG: Abi family protein [Rheinheimera sp.]
MANLLPYTKPHKTSRELCQKLVDQNLTIEDLPKAIKILDRCSYYRFKAYLIPFQNEDKTFREEASFDKANQLYEFDNELRNTLFRFIASVEIGVRSKFEQWMTEKTGNTFWYLDTSLFANSDNHIRTVSNVRSAFVDSKELFASHFRNKYFNEFCPFYRDLPPAWIAIELMTFGNLTKLLEGMTEDSIETHKLNRFAQKVGVKNFKSLASWMATIQEVRNHCGHHTRLFNRNLKSPTGIKRILKPEIDLVKHSISGGREEDQLNRLYTAVAAIQKIYTGLGYSDRLGPIINQLFVTYPVTNFVKKSMGFPERWTEEPLLF